MKEDSSGRRGAPGARGAVDARAGRRGWCAAYQSGVNDAARGRAGRWRRESVYICWPEQAERAAAPKRSEILHSDLRFVDGGVAVGMSRSGIAFLAGQAAGGESSTARRLLLMLGALEGERLARGAENGGNG